MQCRSVGRLLAAVREGLRHRTVARGAMNDESSRGHAVLLLRTCVSRATAAGPAAHRAIESRVTIADLAGSEDQKLQGGWRDGHREEVYTAKSDFDQPAESGGGSSSAGRGSRAATAGQIHRSLLCLQRVLAGLAAASRAGGRSTGGKPAPAAQSRLPWRDSALTQLLCRPLGGAAAVTILACVSPAAPHARLSHRTLRYAAECAKIRVDPVPLHAGSATGGGPSWAAGAEALGQLQEQVKAEEGARLEAERKRDEAREHSRSLETELHALRLQVSALSGSTRGLLAAHQRVTGAVGGLVEAVQRAGRGRPVRQAGTLIARVSEALAGALPAVQAAEGSLRPVTAAGGQPGDTESSGADVRGVGKHGAMDIRTNGDGQDEQDRPKFTPLADRRRAAAEAARSPGPVLSAMEAAAAASGGKRIHDVGASGAAASPHAAAAAAGFSTTRDSA